MSRQPAVPGEQQILGGFTQLENGGSFHSYVTLPEGTWMFIQKETWFFVAAPHR
jgi:hypothetical protein